MSRENVEIVRNLLEHFAPTDEVLDVVAPDFVWDLSTFAGWPDQPKHYGVDGLIRHIAVYATYAEALQAGGLER